MVSVVSTVRVDSIKYKEGDVIKIKNVISLGLGIVGTGIIKLIGKPTDDLKTLIILMCIDLIVGFIVSLVWHKSSKTKSGKLSSRAMFKGIAKKFLTLIIVVVAYQLDNMLDTSIIRHIAIISLSIEEILSIIENIAITGINIPSIIKKALDVIESEVNKSGFSNRGK